MSPTGCFKSELGVFCRSIPQHGPHARKTAEALNIEKQADTMAATEPQAPTANSQQRKLPQTDSAGGAISKARTKMQRKPPDGLAQHFSIQYTELMTVLILHNTITYASSYYH